MPQSCSRHHSHSPSYNFISRRLYRQVHAECDGIDSWPTWSHTRRVWHFSRHRALLVSLRLNLCLLLGTEWSHIQIAHSDLCSLISTSKHDYHHHNSEGLSPQRNQRFYPSCSVFVVGHEILNLHDENLSWHVYISALLGADLHMITSLLKTIFY